MLEVSIVDPKVGKSFWISIINCHHGGGGRGGGRGSPIASGCTAEVTDDNSQRADCVKYWFHNRRLSSPYNLDRFFPFARLPAGNFNPSKIRPKRRLFCNGRCGIPPRRDGLQIRGIVQSAYG